MAYFRPLASASEETIPIRPSRLRITGSWNDRPKASINAITSERYSDTRGNNLMVATVLSIFSCDTENRASMGSIRK